MSISSVLFSFLLLLLMLPPASPEVRPVSEAMQQRPVEPPSCRTGSVAAHRRAAVVQPPELHHSVPQAAYRSEELQAAEDRLQRRALGSRRRLWPRVGRRLRSNSRRRGRRGRCSLPLPRQHEPPHLPWARGDKRLDSSQQLARTHATRIEKGGKGGVQSGNIARLAGPLVVQAEQVLELLAREALEPLAEQRRVPRLLILRGGKESKGVKKTTI